MKTALAIFIGFLFVAAAIVGKDPATRIINNYLGAPTFLGCTQEYCVFLHGNGEVDDKFTSVQFLGTGDSAFVTFTGGRSTINIFK